MGTNSKIEYVDHSLGLWIGCTPLPRPGCENCYGASGMKRWGLDPYKVVRTSKATWRQPLVRERATGQYKWKSGDRVFVCSWSDFFHPDADQWRTEAWGLMRKRMDLNWIIVTKRIERARYWIPVNWDWPNRTVVLSVENQEIADSEIPKLLQLASDFPNVTLAVSIEPMLGKVDLAGKDKSRMGKTGYLANYFTPFFCKDCGRHLSRPPTQVTELCRYCGSMSAKEGKAISQVIIGCESINGSLGRLGDFETEEQWRAAAIDIVRHCHIASVPVFVKQIPLDDTLERDIDKFPPKLKFREYAR